MIIINNEIYIMDPSEVSTVVASSLEIIVNMRGGGYFRVSCANPNDDAYRLTQLIFSEIRAGGAELGTHFTTENPPF